MSKHYCNPLDLPYRYQFNRPNPQQAGPGVKDAIYREAADPSMVLFRDRYWIFPSMTAGFFVSDDLVHWNFHEFVGGATSMPRRGLRARCARNRGIGCISALRRWVSRVRSTVVRIH
ncbi:MAG: hypothetical protein ACLRYR_12470 [Bifidobacterium dentium]